MRAVNHIRYMDVMPQSERNLNYPVSLNYAFSLCFFAFFIFLSYCTHSTLSVYCIHFFLILRNKWGGDGYYN